MYHMLPTLKVWTRSNSTYCSSINSPKTKLLTMIFSSAIASTHVFNSPTERQEKKERNLSHSLLYRVWRGICGCLSNAFTYKYSWGNRNSMHILRNGMKRAEKDEIRCDGCGMVDRKSAIREWNKRNGLEQANRTNHTSSLIVIMLHENAEYYTADERSKGRWIYAKMHLKDENEPKYAMCAENFSEIIDYAKNAFKLRQFVVNCWNCLCKNCLKLRKWP